MKKRILCLALVLCLMAALLPATGLAAEWYDLGKNAIGFHYGNGNFLKITMPTEAGKYTYGTAAGETAAQTAADVSALPESGWQWAVKKEESGTRMILNDFNLSFDGQTNGLMLNCDATLELRGTNRIVPTASSTKALIHTNDHDLTITGTGSLEACMTDANGIGLDLDYGYLTVLGGTITFAGGSAMDTRGITRGTNVKATYSFSFDGSNPRNFTSSSSSSSHKWFQFKWEPEKDYAISMSQTGDYLFPVTFEDYTSAPSLVVSISNIGGKAAGDLSVALSGENADSFTLSSAAVSSIPVLEQGSFTVQPKLGLKDGYYKATVTVSGSNIEAKSFAVGLFIREGKPVNIGTKEIKSVDDLKAVASSTGVFTVSEAGGSVTIKLLCDIEGRLDINYKDAYIIVDANGKLFSGKNTNQPITLEHKNNITVELIGNGIYAPGNDSTIFVGNESTLIVRSATILGKLYKYSDTSTVKFALEEGAISYTVKKNGADLLVDPYMCGEMKLSSGTAAGDTLVVATGDVVVYNVVFKNWDGSELSNRHYKAGDTITVPSNPSRSRDNTYEYSFAGWDKPVEEICNVGAVYTATFEQKYREYTVYFYDYNGKTLSKETYHYGDVITPPADPTRPADDTYTYTFSGWGSEITTCTGSKTYWANYTKEYIDYTVTFQKADGTVLSTATYHYSDAVVVPADPAAPSAEVLFVGWDKAVSTTCKGNAVYTAVFAAPGDMDLDGQLTTDDAVYLLLHTMFGTENYPVPDGMNRDFDGSGKVNTDDAVYLLLHVMFGAKDYPLSA